MIEIAIAIAAALYTARFIVREASPRPPAPAGTESTSAHVAPPVIEPALPPASEPTPTRITHDILVDSHPASNGVTLDMDATQAIDISMLLGADPTGARETTMTLPATILPASSVLTADRPIAIGMPHLRPDPDRLIQTEVIVPIGRAARLAAFARLALGITLLGAALGLGLLGVVRLIQGLFN